MGGASAIADEAFGVRLCTTKLGDAFWISEPFAGSGIRITSSATRSASCSYASPGSLMRSLVWMPSSLFSRQPSHSPLEVSAPQAHLRCTMKLFAAGDAGLTWGSASRSTESSMAPVASVGRVQTLDDAADSSDFGPDRRARSVGNIGIFARLQDKRGVHG